MQQEQVGLSMLRNVTNACLKKKPDEKIGVGAWFSLHLFTILVWFSTFQFTTKQSTAPVVNLILPSQLVENLDNSVEKVEHPCGKGGESVGKTMDKNKNCKVLHSSDSLLRQFPQWGARSSPLGLGGRDPRTFTGSPTPHSLFSTFAE